MPKSPEQKELQRDKATIRDSVRVVRNPETNAAAKAKAVQTISLTVLKGTGHGANGDTPKLLANLTSELLDNGSVGLSGIDTAIKGAAIKLDIPKSELDAIPEKVKQRLDRLV